MSIAASLDKNLGVPFYRQLQRALQTEVESGKWQTDEQLDPGRSHQCREDLRKVTSRPFFLVYDTRSLERDAAASASYEARA